MKIGILTYHRAINYGAFLQANALCARLNTEKDIVAEIIDYRTNAEKKFYSLTNWHLISKILKRSSYQYYKVMLQAFSRAELLPGASISEKACVSDDVEVFKKIYANNYDIIIAGSDEIWKLNGFRGFPNAYWLIGDLGCLKVSYAASSRSKSSLLDNEKKRKLKTILKEYTYIGVRDKLTYELLVPYVDDSAKLNLCCDPSFLYDFPISNMAFCDLVKGIDKNKKNVVVMTENDKIAEQLRKNLGKKYNLVSVFKWHKGYINKPDLTPLEWLQIIKNADFVIASYFHAICYSIINHTNFIALGTTAKSSKLKELLCYTAMEKQFIENAEEKLNKIDIEEKMRNVFSEDDFKAFITDQRKDFSKFIEFLRRSYANIK